MNKVKRAYGIFKGLLTIGAVIYILVAIGINIGQRSCSCTVNYGGHNMSVEDTFERAGEGLTVDQADEVKILIEEYCDNGGE